MEAEGGACACKAKECGYCTMNVDCTEAGKTKCNTDKKKCVDCFPACSGETAECKADTGACVGCIVDTDCTQSDKAKCKDDTNICVRCTADKDCTEAEKPTCKADSGTCVAE